MENITVSQRAAAIKPSPTLVITARAAELRAEGRDIISLSAGEPDFDTPQYIKDAAIQALADGHTKYTPVGGTVGLINAITDKLDRENRLQYGADQILVSCGCKHSLYNLMQALLNPGDEVIIPAPYWVSYPDMARLAGANPVIVDTTHGGALKLTPQQLGDALTGNSKLLILNSPSNPTGQYYGHEELAALGRVLADHPQVLIASDDIYEHILWDEQPFRNIVNVCPELYHRCVILNGVSKAYSMTGWRIGYAAGPAPLIAAMKKIQSQSTSNPCSISQFAAQAALQGDQSYITDSNEAFKQRHDYVHRELNSIDGVQCHTAHGTFYSFPNVRELIAVTSGVDDDVALSERLLDPGGVATVPGTAFGAPGYLRISYATSMENLQTAIQRIKQTLG